MNNYLEFLDSKKLTTDACGKEAGDIHPVLFDFQAAIVRWAVKRGRAAIFADVGLGKTLMQLEWARQMGETTLILAPLAVAQQTVEMAREKLAMDVRYVRSQADVKPDECRIYTANYEMLDAFDGNAFGAVILDESSILKNFSGVTKKRLVKMFKDTPYKLACTATPAPNDLLEIGNHAEFLGVMSSRIMTSIFFTHDSQSGKDGTKYRLKKHAIKQFYQWLASWAVALKKPSDVGPYDDRAYQLPPLDIEVITVDADYTPAGMLKGFGVGSISAVDAKKIRRQTVQERVETAAALVNISPEQHVIWTGLNDEASTLRSLIVDSINVHGSLSLNDKVEGIQSFISGQTRNLITKTKIAGMGINMQHCHRMDFLGIDFSWEGFYQAIGRVHRFGQTNPVKVRVFISEQELPVYQTIERKGREAKKMTDELINASRDIMTENISGKQAAEWHYREDSVTADSGKWTMWLGDSCQRMPDIPDNSVGLSVYSPPFGQTIFIYSATERDLGNSRTTDEFMQHYRFIIDDLLRITMPGRMSCVHIQDTKLYANRDGARGIQPLSDMIVEEHLKAGWIYRGRVTIDKNPQIVATRNHDNDLLFVTGQRDATDLAPMNTDYLLLFKKPGDNPVPVTPYQNGEMSEDDWILWARACWYSIRETNVLNVNVARANEDERHLCPLQLDLIERCIKMWSNPGELVFSPFGGIGSEIYEAIKWRRRGLAIELKPEYFKVACQNLREAEMKFGRTLFDLINESAG